MRRSGEVLESVLEYLSVRDELSLCSKRNKFQAQGRRDCIPRYTSDDRDNFECAASDVQHKVYEIGQTAQQPCDGRIA